MDPDEDSPSCCIFSGFGSSAARWPCQARRRSRRRRSDGTPAHSRREPAPAARSRRSKTSIGSTRCRKNFSPSSPRSSAVPGSCYWRPIARATGRPGSTRSYAAQMPLKPLSRADSLRPGSRGAGAPGRAGSRCDRGKADGNPFFLEQLAFDAGEARMPHAAEHGARHDPRCRHGAHRPIAGRNQAAVADRFGNRPGVPAASVARGLAGSRARSSRICASLSGSNSSTSGWTANARAIFFATR